MRQMRNARKVLDTWLDRRSRGRSDLYALSVVSFAAIGHRALGAGGGGMRVARTVVRAILTVLVLANLEQGGWFRRGVGRRPGRGGRHDDCR
jgi:hypothetical protein